MSFLFFILTIFLPFSTNAIELPPKEAGSDFIRLFETGIAPKDRSYFYYTGFGEGYDADKQAYAEAQKKLTDKITGMQKIINTPSFTPFLFISNNPPDFSGDRRVIGLFTAIKWSISKNSATG